MCPSIMQLRAMKNAIKIQLSTFTKVLDGNAKLRETAITIGQALLNEILPELRKEQAEDLKEQNEAEKELALKAEKIGELDKEIAFEQEMLQRARAAGIVRRIDRSMATLKDLNDQKAKLTGVSKDEKHMQDEFSSLKGFFKRALQEETVHLNVRQEIYKSFWMHNLESHLLSTDKTATLYLLLNLRDRTLFGKALKDLCAHIQAVDDREWALALFKKLIDQDIIPEHHSNVWHIWTTVANFAEGQPFESDVLRLGFECNAPITVNFIEMALTRCPTDIEFAAMPSCECCLHLGIG